MAYNPDKIIEKILSDFSDLEYIRPEDIPEYPARKRQKIPGITV